MIPGVYVHLPFCRVRCSYCDFPLTTRLALQQPYYAALLREFEMRTPPRVDTIYFGGGTPSVTPPDILRAIQARIQVLPGAEITIEVNPDDITTELLNSWLELGMNRLSIGVQSFEHGILRSMLRRHTPDDSIRVIESSQEAGFRNISLDLILGYPGQSEDSFLSGLKKAIQLRPQHISLYLLEIHEETLLQKRVGAGKEAAMQEENQVNAYLEAVRMLSSAGFRHYEVSNFALPGFESRHNLKYWTHAPYYAYGAGACSYFDSMRIQNIKEIPEYIRKIESGEMPCLPPTVEDRDTGVRNALIFGLRQVAGIDMAQFSNEFGVEPISLFEPDAAELIDQGLLEVSNGRLKLTLAGLLLSNEVLSRIV